MTEAFHMAWNLVKNREPVYPIGIHNNRKIVMYHGKPYYQSSGSSGSPIPSDNPLFDPTQDDQRGYKVPGGWYGFQGIDTENKFGMGEGWYAKANNHPDFSPHTRIGHSSYKTDEKGRIVMHPNIYGSSIANYVDDPNNDWMQWPEISADEVNERLTQRHGWPGVGFTDWANRNE